MFTGVILKCLPVCRDSQADQDVPKNARNDEKYKDRENPVVWLRVRTGLHRGAA